MSAPFLVHGPGSHRGSEWLDTRRLLEPPAEAGLALLGGLDALGGRVERRFRAHRQAIPASSRVSLAAGTVLGAGIVVAGLFSWGVLDAASGASQWMTAPGAGNAEAIVQTTPSPSAAAPVTRSAAVPAAKAASGAGLTVHETLVLLDGGMTGHDGDPEFVGSSNIDFPAGATIVLSIYSFDTGTAPLAKGLPYYKALGTVGGTETVNGKTVTSIPNADLAHTFTVPGLGLNLAIPAATATKKGAITPAVVTASFHLTKKGSFTWQCYAPCGSGKDGMEGAMTDEGLMTGKVNVG